MSAAEEAEIETIVAELKDPYHFHQRDSRRTLFEAATLILTPGIIIVPLGLMLAAWQYYHCECEGCRMERAERAGVERKRFENKMD